MKEKKLSHQKKKEPETKIKGKKRQAMIYNVYGSKAEKTSTYYIEKCNDGFKLIR